ncbi:MAG: hypothetical protein M0C28_28070 [Candidatus Moduliflexus flocculans]|nr:hypothetical protein [Candidatus Moduliflexus flocculans]
MKAFFTVHFAVSPPGDPRPRSPWSRRARDGTGAGSQRGREPRGRCSSSQSPCPTCCPGRSHRSNRAFPPGLDDATRAG